jgi:hypothetical protein
MSVALDVFCGREKGDYFFIITDFIVKKGPPKQLTH